MRLQPILFLITCLVCFIGHASARSIRPRAPAKVANIANATIHTPSQRVTASTAFSLTFSLSGQTSEFRLSLEPNHDLLSQNLYTRHVGVNGEVRRTETSERAQHKVYRGKTLVRSASGHWETAGWARAFVVQDGNDPLFQGAFSVFSQKYHIGIVSDQADSLASKSRMVIYHDYPGAQQTNGEHDTPFRELDTAISVAKRQYVSDSSDLTDSIGSTSGCPTTRRVAVVGIATDCTYTAEFDSAEEVQQSLIDMVNTASEVFESTFNISLAIHNLTITDSACPSNTSNSTPWNADCSAGDLDWRLNQFTSWRRTLGDRTNAYWTLMSGCPNEEQIGVSWTGELCNSQMGANVVAQVGNAWQVFAHESAHIFGAVHDCTADTCSSSEQCCPLSTSSCNADAQYLMNPVSTSSQSEFSPCTIGNICSMMGSSSIETSCLVDSDNVPVLTVGQCGNGIVEEGEDCDCGEDDCSECCDGSTCRFREGAVCDDAAGSCCTNCQFLSADTVCRASTSDCDLSETCTGDSGACPTDRYIPDGDSCGTESGLFCASGQCTNRDMQCRDQMSGNSTDVTSCGENSCSLRCSVGTSSGPSDCMDIGQSVLDGTPCDGGLCESGQCQTDEGSWVDEHRSLVIGLSVGVGGALVLAILAVIIFRCCTRRKRHEKKLSPAVSATSVPDLSPPYITPQHGPGAFRYA